MMTDINAFYLVEINGLALDELTAKITRIQHGDDVNGKNFYQLVSGRYCSCAWCEKLEGRIQSRARFFFYR